ncbi:MAG: NAD(P)H-quinone oxidoreductase [Gemmatimonadota bacterium]
MKAVIYTAAGTTDVIQLRDVPTPEPGSHQIRVRVHTAGLNRADILQRRGSYPAPPGWPADIGGLEYAGTVEALGRGVTRWDIGDRVMGLVGGGAHAEAVVVHQDEALEIPAALSFVEAAAIPEAWLTAYDALVTRGHLQRGERVLIHAVGSGVGTAATQLAHHYGATAVGTSRQPAKLARAREFGLDLGIDTSDGAFRDKITEPVHVILDVLGGPALGDNLALLAPLGRLVMLGQLQGHEAATSLSPILRKRLTVVGSVMRTRSLEERISLVAEFSAQVLPHFPPLRAVVGATFPMADAASAHGAMERDETFGKTVLTW